MTGKGNKPSILSDREAALLALTEIYWQKLIEGKETRPALIWEFIEDLTERVIPNERGFSEDDLAGSIQQCIDSLSWFTSKTHAEYRQSFFHQVLAQQLQDAALEPNGRVIINMPPRHGKSELASIRLPAWILGRAPETNIMLISNTQLLASRFSRQARWLTFSDAVYRRIFPKTLPDKERQTVSDWRTTAGGGLMATGVGGSISGHGADLMIIDDPHQDGDWMSAEALNDVFDWYVTAARTRLSKDASVILLMTRWHVNDLAGRLLRAQDVSDEWRQIIYPAVATEADDLGRETGEVLWPERFPIEALEKQRQLSLTQFEALYQNNPEAFADFSFAHIDFDALTLSDDPGRNRTFATCDFAVSAGRSADYNVIAFWDYNKDDAKLTMLDHHRFRGNSTDIADKLRGMLEAHGPVSFYIPDDLIETALKPLLNSAVSGLQMPKLVLPRVDKQTKAQQFLLMLRDGRIGFLRHDGLDIFLRELRDFPNGRHDDCVDVCSLAALLVRSWD